MSSSPKRSSKHKASYQVQPPANNGSQSLESNQGAGQPLGIPDPEEVGGSTENSSAAIPALHRPPARPLAQSISQPDPGPVAAAATGEIEHQQPIPPPSEPMQYRAIGLVKGQYIPSEEQFNRGALLTIEGTLLDTVLLGRVMSLVKKHLDLEREYLWVVYPRTREKQRSLHIQILGVWEPAELNPDQFLSVSNSGEAVGETTAFSDGYFSVRGEVIHQAEDQEYVVVKIKQAPRKDSEDAKAFKLRLEGVLPSRGAGYFWNLDVRRQDNTLVIDQANSIGLIPPRKSQGRDKPGSRSNPQKPESLTHSTGTKPLPPSRPMRQGPTSKPIKRNDQGTDS